MTKKITSAKKKAKSTLRVKKAAKLYPLPATDEGMVGEQHAKELCRPDIRTSLRLIDRYKDKFSGFKTAIDLAGGIGRVSR